MKGLLGGVMEPEVHVGIGAVRSVPSIFLGGLYDFFHVVDNVLLDLVSGCCPLALGAEAKFVGSF